MIRNFDAVTAALADAQRALDHQFLNDVPGLVRTLLWPLHRFDVTGQPCRFNVHARCKAAGGRGFRRVTAVVIVRGGRGTWALPHQGSGRVSGQKAAEMLFQMPNFRVSGAFLTCRARCL